MKTVTYRGRIATGQVLAGLAALVTALIFTGLSFAGSEDHRTLRLLLEKQESPRGGIAGAFKELFRNPVIRIGDARSAREVMTVAATAVLRGTVGEMKNPFKIYLSSATCTNLVKLDAALKAIVVPEGMKANYMIILAGKIVDHTTMEYLHGFQDRAIEAGHTCVLVGMDQFLGLSDHTLAYRVSQVPGDVHAFA